MQGGSGIESGSPEHGEFLPHDHLQGGACGYSGRGQENTFPKGFGKHTGLWLFLTREILAITGITITETGVPGKGARFEMTVPNGAFRFTDK